jgi:hypothetical protein
VPVTGTGKVGGTFNLYPFNGQTGPGELAEWKSAINEWNTKTGTKKACGKVYFTPNEIPTLVPQLQAFIDLGIQAMISVKPAIGTTEGGTAAAKTALANAIKAFHTAGLDAEVTLWNEVGPRNMSASKYHQYVQYYGPVIREYYPLIFDVESYLGPAEWANYNPTHAYVDGYAIDFYCSDYVKNDIRLGPLLTLAGDLPVGVWEIGNTSHPGFTPTPKQLNSYMSHIQSTLTGRLAKGLPVGSNAWYNGPADASQGPGNEIVGQHPCSLASQDITDFDTLWKAVNGKSPA